MEKLILVVAVVLSMFTLSCEPEDLGILLDGHGSCPIEDEDFESSYVSSYDIMEEEKEALQRLWKKDNHMYFNKPIKHGFDIIYYDRDLMSINRLTGKTNWTVDLGFISSFENSVQYEDAIYLTGSNKIFGVDINSGELIFDYEWPGHENLHSQILIDDGVMYVSLNDCDKEYSALAYCPISNLRSGEWVYFNRKIATENEAGFTSIGNKIMFTKENKDKVVIAFTYVRDPVSPNTSIRKLEAFNVTTDAIEWTLEEGIREIAFSQMLVYKEQLILRGPDYLLGIDQETGMQLWRENIGEYDYSLNQGFTFFIYENKLLVFNSKHSFATYSNDTVRREIARAYDLDDGLSFAWQSFAAADVYKDEQGISKSTFNVVEDKIYYISGRGFLMDIDLITGELTRHHEELMFDSGMYVTPEKHILAIPKFDDLWSFSLE